MWRAAEPRAAFILAYCERESKQFRGDRILHLPQTDEDRRSCGLVRGERWVSGTKIETRVDQKSADFEKNSRLMVERLTEFKNQEQQIQPGRRRESHRSAAQKESADRAGTHRQAD